MVSNQKLQNALDEIKQICNMETALYSANGKLTASTREMQLSTELARVVEEFAESLADSQTFQEFHLYSI